MHPAVKAFIRIVDPQAREHFRAVVRHAAARAHQRRWFARIFESLDFRRREWLFAQCVEIFVGYGGKFEEDDWWASAAGRRIRVPLRRATVGLDWQLALAISGGQDADVRHAYEILLSSHRPRMFFDVGANFGTHSIVFLAQNVNTVSFEPNPVCIQYFRELCRANNLQCHVEASALGSTDGEAVLSFPENEEWLGTTRTDAQEKLEGKARRQISVPQITLDGYVERSGLVPDLIKIDTEGGELSVLQGSIKTLERSRPLVIFESWRGADRQGLLSFFGAINYQVCALPTVDEAPRCYSAAEFIAAQQTDFLAVHDTQLVSWRQASATSLAAQNG